MSNPPASIIHITFTTEDGKIGALDISSDTSIDTLKSIIEAHTQIPTSQQQLTVNGHELSSISNLTNNELIFVHTLHNNNNNPPNRTHNQPMTAETLRAYVRGNPQLLQQLLHQNPTLAEAILSDDITMLESLLRQQETTRREAELEQQRQIEELNADPFNLEAQKKIEERIREDNVMENFENALEINPEAFGRVVMLYIDCEVNGKPVKAFVDSGAQSTIMSAACAERCGIMRLIDRRFSGIAKGVGTARIVGKVHVAPLKIGKEVFASSFTILDEQNMDFLLGLDMLKRFQAIINLKDNVLEIGSTKAPFLAEKDIPLHMRGESTHDESSNTNKPNANLADNNPKPNISIIHPPSALPSVNNPKNSSPIVVTHPPVVNSPQITKPSPKNQSNISNYDPAIVQQLMDLGYSREQVIKALQMYRGNADLAAAYLFETGGL